MKNDINYINKVSIYGMMNKLSFFDDDLQGLGFYKKKDKSKVTYFKFRIEDESKYEQINYMYLDDDPNDKNAHMTEQIISIIGSDSINLLPGKQYREIRETRNKFNKIITVKQLDETTLSDVLNMIETWRYQEKGGIKYMWQEHAAIDKSIVKRYVETDLKDYIHAFVFYNGDKCVGYSTIEKNPLDFRQDNGINIPEYKYLTRKVLIDPTLRNLTEYVDWYTFHHVFNEQASENILINWGCSSGGVKWYKMNKWPLYCLDEKWFLTIKNKKII